MGHRLPILKRLTECYASNVFILSYRGYGRSEGIPDEPGICLDAQAAYNHVQTLDMIDKNRIVLYGQSIGAAVAFYIASRNPVSAIVVENAFTSLPEVIPHVIPLLGWARSLCHQKWDTLFRIQELLKKKKLPNVLVLVGERDEMVPPAHGKHIYGLLREKLYDKVVLSLMKDGSHNDTCLQPGYFEVIAQFLATLE